MHCIDSCFQCMYAAFQQLCGFFSVTFLKIVLMMSSNSLNHRLIFIHGAIFILHLGKSSLTEKKTSLKDLEGCEFRFRAPEIVSKWTFSSDYFLGETT